MDSTTRRNAARFVSDTTTWADRRGFILSDRIWSNKQQARRYIDEAIRRGIADGTSVSDIANELMTWVRPSHSRYGGSKARYAADRLAGNEMRRAYNLAAQDTALTDPAGGFMRYTLNRARHIAPHDCDTFANHDQGLGRGIWPAQRIPLPPQHPNCRCEATPVPYEEIDSRAAVGMDEFVEQLRVEYDLADPTDMSPADLAEFRRQTAQVREDVQLMVRGWLEQAGTLSREQLMESSPTVRSWVESVRDEKARRRGR